MKKTSKKKSKSKQKRILYYETKTVGILKDFLKGMPDNFELMVFIEDPKAKIMETHEVVSFYLDGRFVQINCIVQGEKN